VIATPSELGNYMSADRQAHDYQGQGLSGDGWARSAPVASADAAPFRAGALTGVASRCRAAVPTTARPVAARRYAPSSTALADQCGQPGICGRISP